MQRSLVSLFLVFASVFAPLDQAGCARLLRDSQAENSGNFSGDQNSQLVAARNVVPLMRQEREGDDSRSVKPVCGIWSRTQLQWVLQHQRPIDVSVGATTVAASTRNLPLTV